MPTLTYEPSIAIPSREVRVSIALTGVDANYASMWVTSAPTDSALQKDLDNSGEARKKVYDGTGGAGELYRFTPDKPGVYNFIVQEYTRGSTYGGGYERDPNADTSLVLVGSETAVYVYVAQKVTQQIGFGADTATLVLYVQNATIQSTTVQAHGEKTPRLEADNPTPAVQTAILNTTAEVAALANVAASTALGNLSTIITEMIDELADHRVIGTIHNGGDDTANTIFDGFRSPATKEGFIRSVNEFLKKLRQHMLNDDNVGGGIGSQDKHMDGGVNTADWTNIPLFESIGDMAEACGALADAWRAYEAHRARSDIHTSADSTNTLTALPVLLLLHKAFLAVTRASSPAAPATVNSGANTLIHGAGFIGA